MLGQVRGERSRLSSSAGAAVRPARREQQCRYAPIEPQAAVSACPAGNAAPRPFEGHTNSCELDLPGGAIVRDHRLPTTVPGERQREMTDLLLVLLLLVLLFGALGSPLVQTPSSPAPGFCGTFPLHRRALRRRRCLDTDGKASADLLDDRGLVAIHINNLCNAR